MITRTGNILFNVTAMSKGPTASAPTPYLTFPNIYNHTIYFSSQTSYSYTNLTNLCNTNPDLIHQPTNTSSNSGLFLWLGSNSNNTTPSILDYNLDSPFASDVITYSTLNLDFTANGEAVIGEVFTNNTASNITVKEIGLFGKTSYIASIAREDLEPDFIDTASTPSLAKVFLMGREIIEPVTLAPNQSINVSFKITYIQQ